MKWLTAPLLALLAKAAFAQLPADFESKVDDVCKEWNKPNAPGGVVGVAVDGKLVLAKGYGLANIEAGMKNTADTVMDVGSVSKQFTAMCILLLEEEGKLSTSDDINKYLPEIPTFGQVVTIDHLMHMTSGLRDYLNIWVVEGYNFSDLRTPQQALETMVRQTGANSVPGAKWNYCNSGYMLLAEIVQRVSGKSLAVYAKSHIFDPLKMEQSHFETDESEVVPGRATSYAPTFPGKFAGLSSTLGVYGDGGVLTTLADLTKWHENFYNNKLGKGDSKLIDKMLQVGKLNGGQPTNYACGLTLDKSAGQDRVQHGGNWLGFNAMTARFPKKHVSIFTLGNDGTNLSSQFNTKIAELIFGTEKRSEPPVLTVSDDVLKRYPGTYLLPDGRAAEVTFEPGQLSIQLTGQQKFPIFPESETLFFLKVVQAKFEFKVDTGNKVTGAAIHQGGAQTELTLGKPYTVAKEDMEAFVGHYKGIDVPIDVDITLNGERLEVRQKGEVQPIKLVGKDRAMLATFAIVAVRDASGVVRAILVNTGRADGLKFLKSS
ncbi:MAG: serine hydrolase [Chthonomonadaceae bacterium]|nr:serine hydrolase [Chthonomonadaceae bacterium]